MKRIKPIQIMTSPDMFNPDLKQRFNRLTGERINYGYETWTIPVLTTARKLLCGSVVYSPKTGQRLEVWLNNMSGTDKAYFKDVEDPKGRTITKTGKELQKDGFYLESTALPDWNEDTREEEKEQQECPGQLALF